MTHPYIAEQMVAVRHAEIRQAMQQSRKAVRQPQRRTLIGVIGTLSFLPKKRVPQLRLGKA